MENSNEETIIRIWNHCFGNDADIATHDSTDAAMMLEKAGIFTPNDPNSAELLLMYRPNRSINCSDIASIIDNLKKENKQVVFLVVDYLKRLKPIATSKELRIELGNISNELKSLALEYDIPVLTAQQLNRNAFASLEEAESFEEKLRASNKLGASEVGESIDIIQNVDYAFIVNRLSKRVVDENGDVSYNDRYFFLKLVACRSKQPDIISIKHRFADDNDMRLIEDINLGRPLSTNTEIELIKQQLANRSNSKTQGGRQII